MLYGEEILLEESFISKKVKIVNNPMYTWPICMYIKGEA